MTWSEPDYGTLYLLNDEAGIPYALATYLDLVMFVTQEDISLWPQSADDVEYLLWSFDACETGRTVRELLAKRD